MRYIASFFILFLNIFAWCIEWEIIIGYNEFRHQSLFYVSFGLFILIAVIQFFLEINDDENNFDEQTEKDRLGVIIGIGASLLLAISILASLPIISQNTPPILKYKFHWGALTTFLWIVFGVFWVSWGDSNNEQKRLIALVYARRIKSASLSHALGWAGTSAIMLLSSIKFN